MAPQRGKRQKKEVNKPTLTELTNVRPIPDQLTAIPAKVEDGKPRKAKLNLPTIRKEPMFRYEEAEEDEEDAEDVGMRDEEPFFSEHPQITYTPTNRQKYVPTPCGQSFGQDRTYEAYHKLYPPYDENFYAYAPPNNAPSSSSYRRKLEPSLPVSTATLPMNDYPTTTTGRLRTPVKGSMRTVLTEALESSVSSGILDIYSAGKALLAAHRAGSPSIREDTDHFVSSFSKTIKGSRSDLLDLNDPDMATILALGNCLQGQITLALSITASDKLKAGDTDTFSRLSGAAFNIKNKYYYPQEYPFSGQQITCDGFARADKKAHIILRKNLFIVLSRACTNQPDIQQGSWLLPQDRFCRGEVRKFPQKFYETLRDFFCEFYNMNYEELDVQYQDSFASLPFLQVFDDTSSKRKYFKSLALGREAFLRRTFHEELKEALVELKGATFVPPEDGCSYGHFEYRKRGKKRDAND